MRALFHAQANDDTYGPGTDLAMALLGIFIVSAAIYKKGDAENIAKFQSIKKHQIEVITGLAQTYNTGYMADTGTVYYIASSNGRISIENAPVSQAFSFGEGLLFEAGHAELKIEGQLLMQRLGAVVKSHAGYLKEIQIQGNADTIPPRSSSSLYRSNIELASARATSVFEFFKNQAGLDPSAILMSIVSYGEFKPVQRRDNLTAWNRGKMNEANNTEEKRNRNRRIEIVLLYKQ